MGIYSTFWKKIIGIYWLLKRYKVDFIVNNTKGLETGLDVGCGNGDIMYELNRRGKKVIGVDNFISNETAFIKNIKKMPAEKLDFPDNSFDFVLCIGSLHHFRDKERALKEMMRVAKNKVIINEINYYNNIALRIFIKYYLNPFFKVDSDVKRFVRPSKRALFNLIKTHYWEIYEKDEKIEEIMRI